MEEEERCGGQQEEGEVESERVSAFQVLNSDLRISLYVSRSLAHSALKYNAAFLQTFIVPGTTTRVSAGGCSPPCLCFCLPPSFSITL